MGGGLSFVLSLSINWIALLCCPSSPPQLAPKVAVRSKVFAESVFYRTLEVVHMIIPDDR